MKVGEPRGETRLGKLEHEATAPDPQAAPQKDVDHAQAALNAAYERLAAAEKAESRRALADDKGFAALVRALGTYENAANALAVAMTYLKSYPAGDIKKEDIAEKIVGHLGATTSISRTYAQMMAAANDPGAKRALDEAGVTQTHVVTGPGHGAAANFGLFFLEGTLEKIYPERYPRNAQGLQNLIADFCRPNSPLPSHVFPGVPSVSEGGELGYSMGIAAGAGLANPDAFILAQIGDKEAEIGPLQSAIENHNAVYDFRKGLVLPVVHANGLGIAGTSIISARSDEELRSYLWGLGYRPRIVNAEATDENKKANQLAVELDALLTARDAGKGAPDVDTKIAGLRGEIRALRTASAEITNAELQKAIQRSMVNLSNKKKLALALDDTTRELVGARAQAKANPDDEVAARRVGALEEQVGVLGDKLRLTRTPFLVYREQKGGGFGPAVIDGQQHRGAPVSHQVPMTPHDLLDDSPKTREHLQRWLDDLTRDMGVHGLLPTEGTPLGDAARLVQPRDASLLPGQAPLARGVPGSVIEPTDPAPFAKQLGGRGQDARGSNDLIDDYLLDYTTRNRGDVFLMSADTAESNKLKKTVNTLGRRLNLPHGEHHRSSTGPGGDMIDTLSEQYLMSLAQGVVNSGKQAIISNYEAFFQVGTSMTRQYIKFRKQAGEANETAKRHGNAEGFRPPVPNLVCHLSSLAFAQDHNGFSHQNPGFVDDLAADPRRFVQVLMPPDANTAMFMMDRAVRGKDQVVAVVSDKQPRKQLLQPDEARALAESGGAVFAFASDVRGPKPDVVLAASGGYHTDEVIAASHILKAFNRRAEQRGDKPLSFQVVNIAEPFKLRPPEDADNFVMQALAAHGRKVTAREDKTVFDDKKFAELFPPGVDVVYNFGGFKRTADGLCDGRRRNFSVHGYINEGSTTTRFDMMARNHCDRFTLAADAVEQAFRSGKVSRELKDEVQAWCARQLIAHDERIAQGAGDDPPEIKNGVWPSGDLLAGT